MDDNVNKNTEAKAEHRKGSKIIFILVAVLAVAIVFAIFTSIVLLFFSVGEIEVVGDSRYNYSDIIDASGIDKGNRLYYLNEENAEKSILSAFPYLKSVSVKSYFPNRVKIEIEEFEDIYLIPHENGFCYVNGEFEILEIVDKAPAYERFSGIFIKLEAYAVGEVGSVYQSEDVSRAKDLIELIKEIGLYEDLNIVDVEDKYDNSFVAGKKYIFLIGAMTDAEKKLDALFNVFSDEDFDNEKNAIFYITDVKKINFRYINDENIREEFDFCQK